jgi:hypothetical protein
MSDNSSNSGSARSLRITKKGKKSASAKSAKPTKSVRVTKKNANTIAKRKRATRVLKKIGLTLPSENELRRKQRASRKEYKKRTGYNYAESANSLDPAGLTKADQKVLQQKILDRIYKRIGKRVGTRNETGKIPGIKMNDLAKRIVKNFVEERDYSFNTLNERELVERLGAYNVARGIDVRAPAIKERLKKEAEEAAKRVKEDKDMAKDLFKQRKARIKEEDERIQEAINAARKGVKRQFKDLYKASGKEVSDKDVDQIARLVGQGFEITAVDHEHLKKHLIDERYQEITARLLEQAQDDEVNPCAACDMVNYIKHV